MSTDFVDTLGTIFFTMTGVGLVLCCYLCWHIRLLRHFFGLLLCAVWLAQIMDLLNLIEAFPSYRDFTRVRSITFRVLLCGNVWWFLYTFVRTPKGASPPRGGLTR